MSTTVPTKAHWNSLGGEPVSFDPGKVWTYTAKVITEDGLKRWSCTWCNNTFGGHNFTKALYHQAGFSGKEIVTCLGASNGDQPSWFTSALRSFIRRQDATKKDKLKVRVAMYMRGLCMRTLSLCQCKYAIDPPCHAFILSWHEV